MQTPRGGGPGEGIAACGTKKFAPSGMLNAIQTLRVTTCCAPPPPAAFVLYALASLALGLAAAFLGHRLAE